MRPRAGRKTEKKRAIAAAAMRLFINKGFSATTVEEIAESAGISPRTFFRYYRTKSDVVLEQQVTHLQRLRERVRVAPRRLGLFEAMETAAKEHARYLEEERIPRLVALWLEDPDLARRRQEVLHVEIPMLLADDFATREGASSYSSEHVLAGRILMSALDESLTPHVIRGRAGYVQQVEATFCRWKNELEGWVGSSTRDNEAEALSLL